MLVHNKKYLYFYIKKYIYIKLVYNENICDNFYVIIDIIKSF